jgi:hypothetical protein
MYRYFSEDGTHTALFRGVGLYKLLKFDKNCDDHFQENRHFVF